MKHSPGGRCPWVSFGEELGQLWQTKSGIAIDKLKVQEKMLREFSCTGFCSFEKWEKSFVLGRGGEAGGLRSMHAFLLGKELFSVLMGPMSIFL